MNRNSLGLKIICFAFFGFIVLYWICGIVFGKYADNSNHEKREMASAPTFSFENYDSYTGELDRYINDNLPLRNDLVRLNSLINITIFDTSYDQEAIIGTDNWLFYNRYADHDPLSNYLGLDLLSEEELQEMAQKVVELRDELAPDGREFLFVIVPNKTRVYSEYMPKRYGQPAADYRALQLSDYLQNHTDVNTLYLYDDMMEAKSKLKQDLYYRSDDHWNMIGGYIGASVILHELGIEMPAIDSDEIQITQKGYNDGDLAELLNIAEQYKDTSPYYEVSGYDNHDSKVVENDFQNMISCCAEGADNRKVYFIRDSFSSNMISFIGSQFNESYFRHFSTFSKKEVDELSPDIVVVEFVERNVVLINTLGR